MRRVLNLRLIAKVIGINLLLTAVALISCTPVALIYHESTLPFLFSTLITAVPGMFLFFGSSGNQQQQTLSRRDAYFTVTMSWVVLGLSGALPYIISGYIPSYIDAVFESISGFSTTGASILTDIEALPYSILYWRSLTHWIGGIGIIMLVIVIMPSFRVGGYHLFTMESSLQEKIKPRTISIGYRLVLIYVTLTALEVVFLLAGGMNLYESVCHAYGTIATGGFSPKNTSIAGYSPYIQYVIMIFMLAAGINFSLYYFTVRREFRKVKENSEFKFYLSVVSAIGLIVTLSLIFRMGKPVEAAFREAFFNVISIISCTGFAVSDYLQWPAFAVLIVFLSMFLGASTGSTTGGIKMARHLILYKNMRNIFQKNIHPSSILTVRINRRPLSDEVNYSTLAFIMQYLLFFAIATTILTFMDIDLATSAGGVATCMAGIGPGLGSVGPVGNFAHLPEAAKIILSVMMLLGRLEIYTVLILFSGSFWKC